MFEESISLWASMNSWLTPTVLFVLLNLMIGTIVITSTLTTQNHRRQESAADHGPHLLVRSPSVLQRLKSINFYSYRSQEPATNFLKSPEIETHHHAPSHTTPEDRQQSHFARSPSILQQLKSINLYSYISPPEQQTLAQETPPPREEEEEEEEEEERVEDDGGDKLDEGEGDDDLQTLDEIYSQLKGGGGGRVSRSKSDTKPTAGEPAPPKLPRKMKKSASAKSAFAHFEEADVVESRRPVTAREGKVTASEAAEVDDDDEVDAKADDFINKFKQQLKLQRLDSIIRYKEMIGRGSGTGK